MCTSNENLHLIDTKIYLFHAEYHVRNAVTKVTQITAPIVLGNGGMHAISLGDTEKAYSYCQSEAGGDGGVKLFLGPRPLERRKTPS